MRHLVLTSYGVIAEGIRNILYHTNQLRFTSKPDYRYLERILQQIKTRNKAREELPKDPDQVKQVRKEGRNTQIFK